MDLSLEIEAVYQRALLLRQRAAESPAQPDLIEAALKDLLLVLEEAQTAQEELRHQNQELIATRQAVERERQRYQALFELAPDGCLVTDRKGKIYQANQAAARLFSMPREYLIHKPLVALIHELDRSLFQTRLINLELNQNWEISLKPRNGGVQTVEITVIEIDWEEEGEKALLWSLRDITQAKQIKHQLQSAHDRLEQRVEERTAELSATTEQLQKKIDDYYQAEQKIHEQAALIDIATDAIFVQDLDYRIRFWSKGAERLYGWTAEEVLGRKAEDILYSKSSMPLEMGVQQTLDRGAWQSELTQVTREDKPIIVASRWTLVRDSAGYPESILVVNTDVTEKKRLEAQFYSLQRMESLGTLASSIAHDLNNILTPILGLSELILLNNPEGLNAQARESLPVIVDSAKRGADLVKQILAFARGSRGACVPLAVEPVLADMANTLRKIFSNSIEIEHRPSLQSQLFVSADPSQLHQILMNLCVNARDAMPEGGTITLTAENRCLDPIPERMQPFVHAGNSNYIVITVADTGIGMSPDLKTRIFEPFFTTKEFDQGTGIGLSTVFRIAKNHGGFIEVDSEIGKGSRFQVYLPAIEAGSPQNGAMASPLPRTGELVISIDNQPTLPKSVKLGLKTDRNRQPLSGDREWAFASASVQENPPRTR